MHGRYSSDRPFALSFSSSTHWYAWCSLPLNANRWVFLSPDFRGALAVDVHYFLVVTNATPFGLAGKACFRFGPTFISPASSIRFATGAYLPRTTSSVIGSHLQQRGGVSLNMLRGNRESAQSAQHFTTGSKGQPGRGVTALCKIPLSHLATHLPVNGR